jgi:Fe-only nitrogenase accessory protein AnfO
MAEKIAVLVDNQGLAGGFTESGVLKLYSRENGEWTVIKELPYNLPYSQGIKAVRANMMEMLNWLGECRLFLAREVAGLPYNILDIAGFNIYEVEGKPEELFDAVLEKEKSHSSPQSPSTTDSSVAYGPIKTNIEGNYYINLKQVQDANASLSSKQLLLPFLRLGTFFELEVSCYHVPPWLAIELDVLRLKSELIKIGENDYKIKIQHKICGEF